ncbi:MAG: hypothetical protein WC942_01850 [Clostridia bacterium]
MLVRFDDEYIRCIDFDGIEEMCSFKSIQRNRLSNIEFDNNTQTWDVLYPDGRKIAGGFHTRKEALDYEHAFFEQEL